MSPLNTNEEFNFRLIPPNLKNLTRILEKSLIKSEKIRSSIMFNSMCLKNNILPKYTHIYMYVYMYVYI